MLNMNVVAEASSRKVNSMPGIDGLPRGLGFLVLQAGCRQWGRARLIRQSTSSALKKADSARAEWFAA